MRDGEQRDRDVFDALTGGYDAPEKPAGQGSDPYGAALGGRPMLTDAVRHSDLRRYAQKQLEGRLCYYEREAAAELNPSRRVEYQAQAARTRSELRRRAPQKERSMPSEEAMTNAKAHDVPTEQKHATE